MTDVKSNEREFMSQVTTWLNEFLKDSSYPFEVASSDPSVKVSEKKTKFPDDLWVVSKQELLKAKAKEILNDLSTLHREGHLHLIEERHALGQYFTNEELVDLIIAFCVRSVSDKKHTYSTLITDLVSFIEQGRKTAVRDVNTAFVTTYWFIGKIKIFRKRSK